MIVVLVLVAALAVVSWLSSRGTIEPRLGDDEVGPFDTRRTAERIADSGPRILAAPTGQRRPIFLIHVGDDPAEGWVAVDAFAPGQDDVDCPLEWTGDGFVDECTGEQFPADGTGLTRYRTRVDGDNVYIDPSVQVGADSTTTTSS
jgi:hypothetical protein